MWPWNLWFPFLRWTLGSSCNQVHKGYFLNESSYLIQLRVNIRYTLSGIGGIISKYNPTIVSISTKLEGAPIYPMNFLEALQSISSIPKESEGEGQYKITLLYLIRNNIWFFIPGVPCFLWRVDHFLDDLHYLSFLWSLKMSLEWLLSSSSDVSLPFKHSFT